MKSTDWHNQRRWTMEDEMDLETIIIRLGTAAIVFTIILALWMVGTVSEATTTLTTLPSATVSQPDYLISPDMADYLQKQGSGMTFTEVDME